VFVGIATMVSGLHQYKMIEAEISYTNPQEVQLFEESNHELYLLVNGTFLLWVISCLVVASNQRRRGVHDFIAGSFVVEKS
jgi:hypothetical protein